MKSKVRNLGISNLDDSDFHRDGNVNLVTFLVVLWCTLMGNKQWNFNPKVINVVDNLVWKATFGLKTI